MTDDRKIAKQVVSPVEGKAYYPGIKAYDDGQGLWDQRGTPASAARGDMVGACDDAKASPPRLVRREKKPTLGGCDYKPDDASAAAAAAANVLRSDYIQLPQLEHLLVSGRLGGVGGGGAGARTSDAESKIQVFPPKRASHDSPKKRDTYERRILLPPQPDERFESRTFEHHPLSREDIGYPSKASDTHPGCDAKDSYIDSGYSTLEETLARLDRQKFLQAEKPTTVSELQELTGRSGFGLSDTLTQLSEAVDSNRYREAQTPESKKQEAAYQANLNFKNDEKQTKVATRTDSSDSETRQFRHRGSTGSEHGSTGSDVTDCSTRGDVRSGYAPVKSKEDRQQERTKTLDASKLEDIRLLSTAILEYLQSRSSEDQAIEDPVKDDSNYTIFKNANASPPPLPQKKHRVLPSPVRVGQSVKVGGFADSVGYNPSEMDDVQGSTMMPHLSEPTHMTWEEVLREARMLGIPLSRSSSRCRSSSDRRSSMSSSAASSDISHQSSPCSSPIRTSKRTGTKEERSGKDRDSKHTHSNKLSIFSLQGWLSKLKRSDRTSSKESSSMTTPKRRQHLSCSSERSDGIGTTLPQPQRRSLSASATQRNRINLSADSCVCSPGGGANISSSCSNKSPSYRPTSSLTYDISASGSRGSSNSFLSTSMVASPSSSSLGSVFSRSSRGSGSTPLMLGTTARDRNINIHSASPLTSSVSPLSTGSSGVPRTPHSLGIAHTRRTSKSPTRYSRNLDLMKTIDQLKDCGWYWGSLGWEEARMKLESAPDGSFLLRDSSDDRYLFSLSFRSQGKVHHTRIEHYKGTFNFSAQSTCLASASIVELIDRAMAYSLTHPYVCCLQPRPPGLNPIPIQLLYPVSRPTLLPSLQQLCRSAIVSIVRIDDIDRLPITDRLKNYVRISQQV